MKYRMRPHEVDAWQLTWENFQELADMVRGRFHQRLTLNKDAEPVQMGWLEFNHGPTGTYEVVQMGNYLVKEATGEWKVWRRDVFETAFEPVTATFDDALVVTDCF